MEDTILTPFELSKILGGEGDDDDDNQQIPPVV